MSNPISTRLSENLRQVRERIQRACERSNRSPENVTLVAITKYAEINWVRALVDLGVAELGESRPQQLVARSQQLPQEIHWHLIGHLQRNKVELILPVAHRIHSVDSQRLIEAIATYAAKHHLHPRVLLEVNVSGEGSKNGFSPDDLVATWPSIQAIDSIRIEGLMTMAPQSDDIQTARPVFQTLRQLRDQLQSQTSNGWILPELSMGMSGDFEIAIEEGATLIRVGSSLFEGLKEAGH